MKKLIVVLALLLALYIYLPYRAAGKYRDALNSGDSAAVAAMVDMPALRKSMKAQMLEKAKKENRLAAAAMVLIEPAIDKMLDGLISRDGIGKLLALGKSVNGGAEHSIESVSWVSPAKVGVKMSGDKAMLYFQPGASGWKLSEVDLDIAFRLPSPL